MCVIKDKASMQFSIVGISALVLLSWFQEGHLTSKKTSHFLGGDLAHCGITVDRRPIEQQLKVVLSVRVSTSAADCLVSYVSKMTCFVSSETLNFSDSF